LEIKIKSKSKSVRMSQLRELPEEMIDEILKRGNLSEIGGLCNSSSYFRKKCNKLAESKLKERYADRESGKLDMYKLYLDIERLSKYTVILVPHTCNDDVSRDVMYKVVKSIPRLLKKLKKWFAQYGYINLNNEIAFTMDNMKNPRSVILDIGNTYDDMYSFTVLISGIFKDNKEVEKVVDEIHKLLNPKLPWEDEDGSGNENEEFEYE